MNCPTGNHSWCYPGGLLLYGIWGHPPPSSARHQVLWTWWKFPFELPGTQGQRCLDPSPGSPGRRPLCEVNSVLVFAIWSISPCTWTFVFVLEVWVQCFYSPSCSPKLHLIEVTLGGYSWGPGIKDRDCNNRAGNKLNRNGCVHDTDLKTWTWKSPKIFHIGGSHFKSPVRSLFPRQNTLISFLSLFATVFLPLHCLAYFPLSSLKLSEFVKTCS